MVKKCNNCGFQQDEFLNLGGRNYCKSCNSEINISGSRSKLDAITVSAYELETTYEFLYGALEWLELYIERAHPNWQQKKQLPKNITRPDLPSFDAEEMRGHFRTSLMGLRSITFNKPQFLLEELQTEFFSWFDNSGININNCSDKLNQELIDFHSILVGKGGDFTKRRRKETDEEIAKMTPEERKKNFREIVAAYQEPLENEDKVFDSMKGKTYKDVDNKGRFSGDADRGKKIFEQINKQREISQGDASNTNQLNNPQQTGQLMDNGNFAVIDNEVYLPVGPNDVDQNEYNIIQQDLRTLVNIPLNVPIIIGGGIATAVIGTVFNSRRSYFRRSLS